MTSHTKTPGQAVKRSQNIINHIALVLDASDSMRDHHSDVIKVADTQIATLAEQSKLNDQETRVSVYQFGYANNIQCLVYDKDVLRLPSIAGLYKVYGMTALCSATTLAVNDLKLTPEKYGDHSFLIYVITDGMENDSPTGVRSAMPTLLSSLPDHWTLAAFAPNATAKHYLKTLGFPNDNVTIWNADDDNGFLEVGEVITRANTSYMAGRASGVRGTSSLFNLKQTNTQTVKKTLVPVTKGSYTINPVSQDSRIDDFVVSLTKNPYKIGHGYYEMTKRETIQGYKSVAILVTKDDELFTGDAARDLVGLPRDGRSVRVSPGTHPGYRIFIQSTSMNRKLLAGSNLLLMR
jgi:uncharacterized protein YegL